MKKILLSLALVAGMFVNNTSIACEACGKGDPAVELRGAMQKLWADHMQWTYATVDAFYHNQGGLNAQLGRLLKNQKDIGAAIVPYYGQAAGDKLAGLLTTHINQAVPVLTAAKNGDQSALKKALDDWYVNAQEIADFLAAANSRNWKQADLREMMKKHIDTTTGYAVELLKGNYDEAVKKYDEANDHMKQMSDELAMGIIKQFPDKFKKTDNKKIK
jgi:hypothetical protein